MSLADLALYFGARTVRSSTVGRGADMMAAFVSAEAHDAHRADQIRRVASALQQYGLSVSGKTVLDFGCGHGALTAGLLSLNPAQVVGVDLDEAALLRARYLHRDERLRFVASNVSSIPIPDATIDAVVSHDVFEHVSDPLAIGRELSRVLTSEGWALIGTWGWRHPFAPHLWSVMPVPWAHLLVSERTLLKACRRVYQAPWYVPNRYDFDAAGRRLPNKYTETHISRDYLNRFLISDFERAFRGAGFVCETHAIPFSSSYARWSRPLVRVPWVREFFTGHVWFVLRRPSAAGRARRT